MQINGMNFSVGADPELFAARDGEFYCAHGLVPGTKHNPYIVDKGAVQVDGMALEFNIDPADNAEQFDENLTSVMQSLANMTPGFEFMDVSSVNFSEKFLAEVPEDALELGCESDYNGYTLDENPKPNAAALMRTAGGHVHVGGFHTEDEYGMEHFMSCSRLARIMDETLGLTSLLWDQDDVRRSMYGKAGAFRPKKYGMEYRTLSNKWIFTPVLRKTVFQGVENAIKLWLNPDYEPEPYVREVINRSDRQSADFKNNLFVMQAREVLEGA